MPQHRWSVAGFSLHRPRSAPRADNVGFVVDKVALELVSLRILWFSPVNIIPPMLHIQSCITWVMDNGPVSSHTSTETKSHPIETIITITIVQTLTIKSEQNPFRSFRDKTCKQTEKATNSTLCVHIMHFIQRKKTISKQQKTGVLKESM
jgi:hypothetical protein